MRASLVARFPALATAPLQGSRTCRYGTSDVDGCGVKAASDHTERVR